MNLVTDEHDEVEDDDEDDDEAEDGEDGQEADDVLKGAASPGREPAAAQAVNIAQLKFKSRLIFQFKCPMCTTNYSPLPVCNYFCVLFPSSS